MSQQFVGLIQLRKKTSGVRSLPPPPPHSVSTTLISLCPKNALAETSSLPLRPFIWVRIETASV